MKPIVFSQDVCNGEPRIDKTRLSCSSVAAMLFFRRMSTKEFFYLYPYLTEDDLKNCLAYCARKQCVIDKPINFCHGCVLDRREDDSPSDFISGQESLSQKAKHDDGYKFLGTVGEYLAAEQRQKFWEISDKLNQNVFNLE
ncbi:MAG TPA: DUF433 domain-containing protein [Lacunisphaera sp.]